MASARWDHRNAEYPLRNWRGNCRGQQPSAGSGFGRGIRSLGTNGAEVSFINQPDLDAGHVRLTLLHGTEDELLQQLRDRLLMGDIQEQVHGEIRIESAITTWFHTR